MVFCIFYFEGRFWPKFKWHSVKWSPLIIGKGALTCRPANNSMERVSLMGSFFFAKVFKKKKKKNKDWRLFFTLSLLERATNGTRTFTINILNEKHKLIF
jgi:hypothetical protein